MRCLTAFCSDLLCALRCSARIFFLFISLYVSFISYLLTCALLSLSLTRNISWPFFLGTQSRYIVTPRVPAARAHPAHLPAHGRWYHHGNLQQLQRGLSFGARLRDRFIRCTLISRASCFRGPSFPAALTNGGTIVGNLQVQSSR